MAHIHAMFTSAWPGPYKPVQASSPSVVDANKLKGFGCQVLENAEPQCGKNLGP